MTAISIDRNDAASDKALVWISLGSQCLFIEGTWVDAASGSVVHKDKVQAGPDRVLSLFPILAERRNQIAGTISDNMLPILAIGRVLMRHPRFPLLEMHSPCIHQAQRCQRIGRHARSSSTLLRASRVKSFRRSGKVSPAASI